MATRQLSLEEKEHIQRHLSHMLGRHALSHACPLNQKELRTLMYASLTPEQQFIVDYGNQLKQAGLDSPVDTADVIGVPIVAGDTRLLFYAQASDIQDHDEDAIAIPITKRNRFIDTDSLNLAPDRLAAFNDWAIQCPMILKRCSDTWVTLYRIIEMANTPGQFKRMVPDLVKYLNTQSQVVLNEQQRRSRMPDAWADFPRIDLRNAVDHIAMCYLLPKPEGIESRMGWNDVAHAEPWAFCRSTLDKAHYVARRGVDEASLSKVTEVLVEYYE